MSSTLLGGPSGVCLLPEKSLQCRCHAIQYLFLTALSTVADPIAVHATFRRHSISTTAAPLPVATPWRVVSGSNHKLGLSSGCSGSTISGGSCHCFTHLFDAQACTSATPLAGGGAVSPNGPLEFCGTSFAHLWTSVSAARLLLKRGRLLLKLGGGPSGGAVIRALAGGMGGPVLLFTLTLRSPAECTAETGSGVPVRFLFCGRLGGKIRSGEAGRQPRSAGGKSKFTTARATGPPLAFPRHGNANPIGSVAHHPLPSLQITCPRSSRRTKARMVVMPNFAISAVVLNFMPILSFASWYIARHGIPRPKYFVAFASQQREANTISSRSAPWATCAKYSFSSTGLDSMHGLSTARRLTRLAA
jgi:hypothetical protein